MERVGKREGDLHPIASRSDYILAESGVSARIDGLKPALVNYVYQPDRLEHAVSRRPLGQAEGDGQRLRSKPFDSRERDLTTMAVVTV